MAQTQTIMPLTQKATYFNNNNSAHSPFFNNDFACMLLQNVNNIVSYTKSSVNSQNNNKIQRIAVAKQIYLYICT